MDAHLFGRRGGWGVDPIVNRRRTKPAARSGVTHRQRPTLLVRDDLPAPPKQTRSIENRRRVKAAALALFGEKGYERTSIDEIARRAGVAVGGVYLHFRSKRQLLLALMEDLLDVLTTVDFTVPPGVDPQDAVRSLVRGAFKRDLELVGAYRAWQEAVLSEPDLAARDDAFRRWTQERVTAVFERLRRCPGARQNIDVRTLGSVMDQFFWALLSDLRRRTAAEAELWLDTAADVTYHALFTDSVREDV
jgi:AcrR family transcriptional regulator